MLETASLELDESDEAVSELFELLGVVEVVFFVEEELLCDPVELFVSDSLFGSSEDVLPDFTAKGSAVSMRFTDGLDSEELLLEVAAVASAW